MSSTQRAIECAASQALCGDNWSNSGNRQGTGLHSFVELRGSLDSICERLRPDDAAKVREVAELIDLSEIPRGTSEVAVAYHVTDQTARILKSSGHRDYSDATQYEIPGTFDLLVAPLKLLIDFKTGRSWVAHPRDNAQMRLLGLAVCLIRGWTEITLEIWKIDDCGDIYRMSHKVSLAKLQHWANTVIAQTWSKVWLLRQALKRGENIPLSEGPWCGYCPARRTCPAKVGMLQQIAHGDSLELAGSAISKGQLQAAVTWYLKAKPVFSAIERQLHAIARENPIALPDGYMYGVKPTKPRERITDHAAAWAIIRLYFDEDLATAAFEHRTSKEAIKRMLKKAKVADRLDGSMAERKRQIEAELRKHGALEETTGESEGRVSRFKP